jgi:hypothetical protein
MKIQIRQGVFETNSSSVHSLSIVKTTEYKDFLAGKIWVKENFSSDENECDLLPEDEAIEFNINHLKNDLNLDDEEFITAYRKLKNFWEAFSSKYAEDNGSVYDDWETFEDEYDLRSTYDYYNNWDDFWEKHETVEDFSRDFVTENGEKYTAWGYYGNDY